MLNVYNLHMVKTHLTQYDKLFVSYQEGHIRLLNVLTAEDVQYGEAKHYRDHEDEI